MRTMIAGGVVAATQPTIAVASAVGDTGVRDFITKSKNFNMTFTDDIILRGGQYRLLKQVTNRLSKIQSLVGYANFALLNFDAAIQYAAKYSSVGAFTNSEKDFLEQIFYTNAHDYGFFGEKILTRLTDGIPSRDVKKVRGTGHFIYKGDSQRLYNKIRKDVGNTIILTSGIRGVVKQMYLFLSKALGAGGNLSKAARSLAPPGHSFHGVGDFDVGKRGYGYRNFTADFSNTVEFKRLKELGYVKIRYPEENPFGVRYEPWHIKVVKI